MKYLNIIFFVCTISLQTYAQPAKQTKQTQRFWIENNNRSFKSSYSMPSSGSACVVLQTMLYDTGKGGPPPTAIALNNLTSSTTANQDDYGAGNSNDNNPPILPVGQKIQIQPSVFDVVNGDMMVFAVTYNTGLINANPATGVGEGTFNVYFFYNSVGGAPFFDEANLGNFGSSGLPTIRNINGGTLEKGLVSSISGLDPNLLSGYKYFIVLKNINPSEYEKNIFITMMPGKNLAEGISSSVMAVLTKSINSNVPPPAQTPSSTEIFVDSCLLGGLTVALAHDPNYLKVKPSCIESTKRGGHSIEYVLHFQNTGEGAADTVIVTMHMPKGLDLKNFSNNNISKAIYGGIDFKNALTLLSVDIVQNEISFKFDPYKDKINRSFLCGTNDCINPIADIRTKGDIVFSVVTTDAADSVLNAFASIEFHSKNGTRGSAYEDPVNTNIATTRIKTCCDCSKCKCDTPCCYIIAGLCWWWWVIIFLIITFIYIMLRRRKKRSLQY